MNKLTLLLGTGLLLSHSIATAQFVPPSTPLSENATIFDTEDTSVTGITTTSAEGGSETVANILKHLEPSIDTSIPETHSQAAERIKQLIHAGKYDIALREIDKFTINHQYTDGTDVQLLFLKARAYAAKGDINKAITIYNEMTFNYPELAEPWNNKAALQMKLGSFDEALESLKMALAIRPNYTIANQNIGLIYTALAKRSFNQAANNGSKSAQQKAEKLQQFLDGK
ncbi:hypothetical protein F9B74_06185 [Pelistega sp. NLN82]|uniref:Uncharacterized protein n=1 Tax=Pelistega ratti TaxID=2652177 RepID=A0A6L9Y6U5_9BURK|nr:tetratricopeptide repeat protein [Pelistega ratti]NEN75915.1 hypothetical protein [Pelistega ratti]